jgi:hypothetical protein
MTIRCLLSQNGLDVDWVNPEDEVVVIIEAVKATSKIPCEIDTEEEDAEE